jgi:hypothetical protein
VNISALLVGGTFMVITMVDMQEDRTRAQSDATGVLGQLTAGLEFSQLTRPLASAAIGRYIADSVTALKYALALSAASLRLSESYLRREARNNPV